MVVHYCWIYVFSLCLRAPRKIDSSIGLPSLNKVVTYLLTLISLRIRAVWSKPLLVACISLSVELLTKHTLEFISLPGGYTGSSELKLVKMPHCWKSQVAVQTHGSKNTD